METIKITSSQIASSIGIHVPSIPKYSRSVLNDANRYAHATREENVSIVSNSIKEFRADRSVSNHSLEEWEKWYVERFPDAIEKATDDTWRKFTEMMTSLSKVTKEDVRLWQKDLIINKSYCGLMVQEAIIKRIATILKVNYRLANIDEESDGIDGFINSVPVQIKPASYNVHQERFEESIVFIYYKKDDRTKDIVFSFNRDYFLK